LEETDSVFAGATVFSGLELSLLSLGVGAEGFSVTLETSIFAGGGFRGSTGEVGSSFLLSTLTCVSKFSLVSVEGLSFRRTVIKKMNRATTAAVMRMLIVDKSNMIFHTSERLKQLSI